MPKAHKPSNYHIAALILTGIGTVGIGLEIIWLYIPGCLGLAMLVVKPPRAPR